MNWNQIEPNVEKLKNGILSVMDKIEELSLENDKLPTVSQAFTTARYMVDEPSYDVVVCGEVNKGKSSLLNAIIGQEILPVNNEIATSQIFRITNSSSESFYLVFTDGTRKQISRDELSRYGSQVDANLQGEPIFQDHTLSYIQVNIPVAFLPNGVSLVDTPGLGALYKSHEWITQNYVSKASAVIFVMDPERPLVEKEKEFILKVLGITPHILFVMTKIDMYAEEALSSIMERNRELLALVYAEKELEAPQIFPVSSTALMKVSTGKVKALQASNLRNSRFPQLKEQLLYIIYKAVGLQQTGFALREAADHTVKCKTILSDKLKVSIAESQAELSRINASKRDQKDTLETRWGEQSSSRKMILDEIYGICNSIPGRAKQMTSVTGTIYEHYESRISSIKDIDSLRRLADIMPRSIVDEVSAAWTEIMDDSKTKVANVLSRANAEIENEVYDSNFEIEEMRSIDTRSVSFSEYVGSFLRGAGIGTILATTGIPIIGSFVAIGVAVGTIVHGIINAQEQALNNNKSILKSNLQQFLNRVSSLLFDVQPNQTRSVVSAFSSDLKTSAEDAINTLFEKQKSQIQQEIKDLETLSSLDYEERQREVEVLTANCNEWANIVEEIKKQVALRNEIAESLGIKTK